MQRARTVLLTLLLAIGPGITHAAPVANLLAKDCKTDIEGFCHDVTLGEGRLAACLYAYSDKISGRCVHALYDVMDQVELVASRVRYVGNVCKQDIRNLCLDTPPGGGRILQCLVQNQANVSAACNRALNDTGARSVIEVVEGPGK